MTKPTLFLLTFFPVLFFGQSDFCNKSYGESYFPLEIGFEKKISWGSAIYSEKITEKTELNGVEYFKYVQDFGNGTSYDLLLRKHNDTIFMYNEVKKKDNILLIAKPEKGLKWPTGEIYAADGKFETPYCNYENLLVIKYKYSNGEKETRYYKKGLGLVAITNREGIKGICMPNKDEAQSLMQPLSATGCEKEKETSMIRECTLNFINSYVSEKLRNTKVKPPKENGSLEFKVKVSGTGEVVEVKSLNTLSGGNPTKNAIVKILKSLPKFNPTKTADKKAVNTYLNISIPIKVK